MSADQLNPHYSGEIAKSETSNGRPLGRPPVDKDPGTIACEQLLF